MNITLPLLIDFTKAYNTVVQVRLYKIKKMPEKFGSQRENAGKSVGKCSN